MVHVEGGTYKMGCRSKQSNCDEREKNVNSVTVRSFDITKFEITNTQYVKFLNDSNNFDSMWIDLDGKFYAIECKIRRIDGEYTVVNGFENSPVNFVSWHGAKAFAKFYKMRLPTEAEWEYAARGGNKSLDKSYTSQETDTKIPNELGIYGMKGGLYEWCSDCWTERYKNNPSNGSASYQDDCSMRVIRGGNYVQDSGFSPVFERSKGDSKDRDFNYGFRVVKD